MVTDNEDLDYSPSQEYRFFVYDADNCEMTYHRTTTLRDAYAERVISDYNPDGLWRDGVKNVVAGEVTHTAQCLHRIERPAPENLKPDPFGGSIDREDTHWPDGVEWIGDYKLEPIVGVSASNEGDQI